MTATRDAFFGVAHLLVLLGAVGGVTWVRAGILRELAPAPASGISAEERRRELDLFEEGWGHVSLTPYAGGFVPEGEARPTPRR